MKPNPIFALHNIAGCAYLLPHGQGIADHKRGIKLNQTSVFLWHALQHTLDWQELFSQFADYCKPSEEELPQLKQDLADFLRQLYALGILLDDAQPDPLCSTMELPHSIQTKHPTPNQMLEHSLSLKIGPILVQLTGPDEAFAPELFPFQTVESSCPDLMITFKQADMPIQENKCLLIQNPELCIYETAETYFLLFPQMPQLAGARLSKHGAHAQIYYKLPITKQFSTDVFHVIRFLFLYTAQKHNCFVLHSASILYKGKAWLFSGQSGMGKSTHTNLWKKLFEVPILNGDLNLLAIPDGLPTVHGLPWCGTSGIAQTDTYPLGGIILLNRGLYDECIELSIDQKILLTTQRLISPAWDANMLQHNLDFMSTLASQIQICLLKCTKTNAAAETAKQWIDLNCYKNT